MSLQNPPSVWEKGKKTAIDCPYASGEKCVRMARDWQSPTRCGEVAGRMLLAEREELTDAQLLEQLYLRYCQLMHYTANQILHDPQLAEDAVQQAFVRILNNLHKIVGIDCPQTKSFVVIIVRNVAINLYHARRRQTVLSLDELADWTPDPADSPAETVESADGVERLARLIAQLPEKYRSVMLLKYENGLSTKEIAQLLALSEETAKKRLQRARKKLEDWMGRCTDAE